MESQDRGSSDVSQSGCLEVFRNRNFTLLWAGVITSNVGSWMQIVAQGWLVYEISGSPLLLGAVAMARAVPMIVLPPVGGVAADRLERLKLLKITQAAAFVIALSQGLIVSLDVVEVWHLVALGLMAGAVNAFDQPTRQALLPELVRREHLSKAIALNSSAWQGSALFGPALAGVVVALAGVAGAFYVNAFSFLAVLAALFLMRGVRERSSDRSNRTVGGDLLARLSYVKATSLITVLLSMAAVTSIFGRSYQLLLPILPLTSTATAAWDWASCFQCRRWSFGRGIGNRRTQGLTCQGSRVLAGHTCLQHHDRVVCSKSLLPSRNGFALCVRHSLYRV
jgi:MFS family permease